MFTSYPTYSPYRTLRLVDPMMRGEDVYALQTALQAYGEDPGVADGIFGRNTSQAVLNAQAKLGLTRDGLAGGQTQTALVKFLADRARTLRQLPMGLAFGQLSHESSCRVGNYSEPHSWDKPGANFVAADGRKFAADLGVAQHNSRFTIPSEAFDVRLSITKLGDNLRYFFNKYEGVKSITRRWSLAAGAWNAPAYANWIAREEGATQVRAVETAQPSTTARATLERYMQSVTAYMEV